MPSQWYFSVKAKGKIRVWDHDRIQEVETKGKYSLYKTWACGFMNFDQRRVSEHGSVGPMNPRQHHKLDGRRGTLQPKMTGEISIWCLQCDLIPCSRHKILVPLPSNGIRQQTQMVAAFSTMNWPFFFVWLCLLLFCFYHFMCMGVFPACMSVYSVHTVPPQARIECQISWDWRYSWMCESPCRCWRRSNLKNIF